MTRFFGLLLVGALAFSAVESARAADGQISDAQLASLGLGGMQKMSDTQGMAVRGKFVFSPLAITQIANIQYNALQGPLGTQAATLFATGTTFTASNLWRLYTTTRKMKGFPTDSTNG